MHLLRTTDDQETAEKAKTFFRESQRNENKRRILHAKGKKKKKFEEEMEDFLRRKKEMAAEKEKDEENDMEDDTEKQEEEEELKPLPNILSMIASSLNKETSKPVSQETNKVSVGRVSSFKEPEAPPNSVERVESDRNIIDYEDDDFLTTNNDTEDIELF